MTLVNMVVVVATVGPLPGLDKAKVCIQSKQKIYIVHQDNTLHKTNKAQPILFTIYVVTKTKGQKEVKNENQK